jgi:hypothetical protein
MDLRCFTRAARAFVTRFCLYLPADPSPCIRFTSGFASTLQRRGGRLCGSEWRAFPVLRFATPGFPVVNVCRPACGGMNWPTALSALGRPSLSAVDGLINGRARIDRSAVAPHAFIPALTGEVVGFPDQRLALALLFR